jgi:hypothetical protein
MKLLTFERFGDEAGGTGEQELAPPRNNRMNTRVGDRFDHLVLSWRGQCKQIYIGGDL